MPSPAACFPVLRKFRKISSPPYWEPAKDINKANVVLDAGILIAALITVNTPPDKIYQAWKKKRFELFTSEWQLEEFRRVSRYPKLRNFISPIEAGDFLRLILLQLRQPPIVCPIRPFYTNR